MGDSDNKQSHIPRRLNVLFFIVFLFFAAIILRLAYVQLVEGEQYKHDLEKYSTRELPIPAPRGRILDRNGEVLVSNKPVYTVTYVEEQNQKINEEQVADKLANILVMDDEKNGTDKELLQKALELRATLPVSFGTRDTEKLINIIVPKLEALPKASKVDSLSDYDVMKAALAVGMRVKPPFAETEKEELKKRITAHVKETGKAFDVANASDSEILRYIMQSNMKVPLSMEKRDRQELEKELQAQLNALPLASELKEESDMKLLRYTAMFDLDVTLPLTEQQRQFQWRKLAILKNMRSYGLPRFIPRRIKENVSVTEVAKIEERRNEFPGIDVIVEPIRQIRRDNDGPIATHILGYINPISPEQQEEYVAQGYSFTDRVGYAGLERYYERELRGKDGAMEVHVNKDSETVEKTERRPAEPGNDLVLSLDWRFQSKVEEILYTSLEEMKQDPKMPKNLDIAHALVMNPKTGDVLAMASYPDYDLNLHYDRKTFNKLYSKVIAPSAENKLIRGAYAPGSTVKMLSVMLSLQEGLTTPYEDIFDPGGYWVGNVYKRNWKLGGHGNVDARRALQVSNNTYMYAMSMRLKDRAIREGKSYKTQFDLVDYYNAQFGLGVKTGVDLPGELTGWESSYTYLGNLADAFIGQYDSFTPMQLGQYVSTIANDGYRLRPHLVKEIRRGTVDPKQLGETLTVMQPDVLNKVDITPKWVKVVQEGMSMVSKPGGTAAYTFRDMPFSIAAKTGTAQTGRGEDNSLIVGYAPYENPQISFVVIVPGGGHGSDTSGPIARKILEAYHTLYPLAPATLVKQTN